MTSSVDTTLPADGAAVSKSAFRANHTTIATELNHGGFTTNTPTNYSAADTQVDTHIAGIDTALTTINSSISTNTSNISTNTTNISTNSSDITTAQADIVTLEGEIVHGGTTTHTAVNYTAANTEVTSHIAGIDTKLGDFNLTDLADTPAAYSNTQFLQSTASGTQWANPSASGGNYTRTEAGAREQSLAQLAQNIGFNPMEFGAYADGTLHTVQDWITAGDYADLAAVQVDYPLVTATTESADWAAIQQCCYLAAAIEGTNEAAGLVYIPAGEYVVNETIRVTGFNNPTLLMSIKVIGAGSGYSNNTNAATIIRSTANDRPVIDMTNCRGGYIGHIHIVGPNTVSGTYTEGPPSWDRSDYITGGSTSGTQNAQCGLSIDGYSSTKPTTSWGNAAGFWGRTRNSDQVVIDTVSINDCVVGLGCHIANGTAQGDNINIYNLYVYGAAFAVSIGNSQARGINFYGGRVQGVHTVFTGVHHGNQHKGSFNVTGMEFIFCTVIAYIDTEVGAHSFKDIECEVCNMFCYTEGQGFGSAHGTNSVPTWRNSVEVINGRWGFYVDSEAASSPIFARCRGGGIHFTNFYFDFYGGIPVAAKQQHALNFGGAAPYVTFDNCLFKAPRTDEATRPTIPYIGVKPGDNNNPSFQSCTWLKPGAGEGPPVQPMLCSRMEPPTALPDRFFSHYGVGMIQDRRGDSYVPYWPGGHANNPSMYQQTISNITVTAGTRTVVFDPADTDVFIIGDIVTWKTINDTGSTYDYLLGGDEVLMLRVTANDGTTVTCSMMYDSATYDASFTGPVYIAMTPFSPGTTATATTSGTTLTMGTGNAQNIFQDGDWIFSDSLAAGTRITSVDSSSSCTINKSQTVTPAERIGGPVQFNSVRLGSVSGSVATANILGS